MNIIRNVFNKNKLLILFYFIVVIIILPLQSIGFSTHSSYIIGEARKGITNDSMNKISKSIFMIAFIWATTHILHILKRRISIHNSLNFTTYFKNEIHKIYLKKYSVNYEESKIGNIITALETMPWLFEKLFEQVTNVLLPFSTAIFFLIIYFFYIDYRIGLITTLMALILLTSTILFKETIKKDALNEYELNEKLNESVNDRLSNIIQIIANNKQENEQNIFNKNEKKLRNASQKVMIKSWFYYSFMDFITFIFIIATLFSYLYLFKKFNKNKIKNEKLIASFLVFFYFIGYLGHLKWSTIQFLVDYSIIKKFMKKHDHSVNEYNNNKDIEIKKDFIKKGIIELRNIYYSHTNKEIYKSLSTILYPGKVTGVFGPSGSGKTTLLLLLLGIYKPSKGDIFIDGVNIKYASKDYLSSQIGFLSQNSLLNNESIIKNIGKPKNDILNAIKYLNVGKILKNVNLNEDVGLYGSKLSNGQRQVVSIIRLYLENNKINLFDEPTSALDPDTKKIILNSLHKIKKENKTVIVVSHDDMIINNVDHIIRL